MGGYGSGRRWHFSAKDTTDDFRIIDVRHWQREGLLSHGRSFSWQWSRNGEKIGSINVQAEADHVTLDYRHRTNGEEWKPERYPVWLTWTPCNFGGERPWFICPAVGCGRRVAKLYGGGIFACRHCRQLAYACQREWVADRLLRKADKIRDRMGWGCGVLNGLEPKPKGMHWRTYRRLCAEHESLVEVALGNQVQRYGFRL
jgi:hypothetical protein